MSETWVRFILFVAFATSLGLGVTSAWFLVKWFANRVLWAFSVPFTLWWLVAALSVSIHVFGVRGTLTTAERTVAPAGPLTPRTPIESVAQ